MYRVTSIDPPRIFRDNTGRNRSMVIGIKLTAPTKRGDEWSSYLGEIRLHQNGETSFSITHINSSAWGNSAYRAAPYGYERPDVEKFVIRECASQLANWRQKLAT